MFKLSWENTRYIAKIKLKYPDARIDQHGNFLGIEVRDGAVIGANATILPGITLYENCFVGAGSVVTKDVYPNEVVVGNPAREHDYVR